MHNPLHNKSNIIFDLEVLVKLKLPEEIFIQRIKSKLSALDSDLVDHHLRDKRPNSLMNEAVRRYGAQAKEVIYAWCEQFEKDYFESVRYNKELWEFIEKDNAEHTFYLWTDRMGKTVKRLLKNKRSRFFKSIVTRESVDLPLPYPDGFFKLFDLGQDKRYDFVLVSHRVEFAQTAHDLGIEFFYYA